MAEGVVANGSPEELLRGALEKIVFFECRVSQLDAELTAARAIAAREKESASKARLREVELETQLGQARSAAAAASSRMVDLEDRVRLLEAERERFLSGLVERARVAGAPGDSEGEEAGEEADLAGFIAELRSDIERLKLWKAAAQKAGITIADGGPVVVEPSAPVSKLAARFEEAGRLGLAPREAERMKERLATRAERSLYETSMDDLSSTDVGRRKRAADCLRAMGSSAAAPLVASAIGRERDPEVKAALLSALGAVGEPAAADIALSELNDPRPLVRAAALEATAALAKGRAESALTGALADTSPMVRRRAVLLLGFIPGSSAADALASALADRDPGVARSAALALSGRPNARAQLALAKALDHHEPAVRRCAADAVARWSGEKVDTALPAVERRRTARRIAEKLSRLEASTLREAVVRLPAPVAQKAPAPQRPARVVPSAAVPAAPLPSPAQNLPQPKVKAISAPRAAVAVVEAPSELSPMEAALLGEVRTSLRGQTAEDLAQLVNADPTVVASTLSALVAQGKLVQRNFRFFMG